MSERMSDEEFELCARIEGTWTAVATGEKAPTRLAIEARRARAAEAALAEELERVAANRAELVDDVASAVAERDAERALVRQLREESARRLRGLKDAEATLRPEELPTGHRDLWSAAEYRMRELDAERARARMAEQTRDGLLEENARLRAALKGLSGTKWWPDRQSRGPCWCAHNSADWFDHADGCKRAAEALGHGGGDETAPPIYEGVEQ